MSIQRTLLATLALVGSLVAFAPAAEADPILPCAEPLEGYVIFLNCDPLFVGIRAAHETIGASVCVPNTLTVECVATDADSDGCVNVYTYGYATGTFDEDVVCEAWPLPILLDCVNELDRYVLFYGCHPVYVGVYGADSGIGASVCVPQPFTIECVVPSARDDGCIHLYTYGYATGTTDEDVLCGLY